LRGDIGPFQYLALGFGTIIGSAWVILLGDWITKAGPGGAILGFLCGGLLMMVIGACYAELTTRIPEAGSEFIYAHRIYGRGVAFVVGWFLVLYLISVTVFEGLALAWIVEVVFPDWKTAVLYRAFGASVSVEALLVSVAGAIVIYSLNYRGAKLAVASHSVLTVGFLLTVLVIVLGLALHGHAVNATPLFATTNGSPWWLGSGAIFAFCAYAMNGFQAIPQAIEERSAHLGLRSVALLIVVSIGLATLFYCLVILSASTALPWRALAATSLPMVTAARQLPYGSVFGSALLLAAGASLLKAWNGIFMMAARLLVAMARAGYVPAHLAALHPRLGSPVAALNVIVVLNIAGVLFGRGAVESIADMSAMMLTLAYLLCCATVLRLRARGITSAFQVPGGRVLIWVGAAGAALMAAVAFAAPFWEQAGWFPLEWRLFTVWSLLGAVVWFVWVRRAVLH
jgi:APA family basic amino acid/polyamine antiporter